MYGAYIIYEFLEKNNFDDYSTDILTDQLNDEYLILLTSLINKNNIKLSYVILIILIDISFSEKGELLFGPEEKVICNIASFLGNNRNDMNLLNLGILLIKNITYKNSLVKSVFKNYNIIQFFNEIYDKFVFDKNFMENLIICMGHFIISRFGDNNTLCSIKIIKTQLNQNIPIDLLIKYVYILYNLTFFQNQKVYEEMIKNEIQKDLMNIYPFTDNNININNKKEEKSDDNKIDFFIEDKNSQNRDCKDLRLLILKILGKMMSSENNEITQKILDSGFAKFINNVFKSTDIKIIKNAFFCLSNICAGTYGQISNLFDNDTVFEAFKIAQYVYETLDSNNKLVNSSERQVFINTFKIINKCISLIIINSLYEKIIPYIRNHNYSIIKIVLKGLQICLEDNIDNRNKDLIILILNSISKLYVYENDKDEDIIMNNSIIFSEFLEKNGFKEILDKLLINSDDNIAEAAENIYDELNYNDNNINEDINIDDIVEDNDDDNDNDDNE